MCCAVTAISHLGSSVFSAAFLCLYFSPHIPGWYQAKASFLSLTTAML
jgi:hypothetical protein